MSLEPVPWFAEGAREWLEERIEPSWTAFEWGSGGSTLWLEGLCIQVVSVEHDPVWCARVQKAAPSARVFHIPPTEPELGDDPAEPSHYRSSCEGGNFRWYARFIDWLDPFDLVLVDGRARASCLAHAIATSPKLLVLDNAEREWYLENTIHLLDGWERTNFVQGDWVTSAWTRG